MSGLTFINKGLSGVDSTSADTLTNGHIFVGNSSNLPEDVAMSGDVTIDNTGATTIKTNVALAGSPTTTTQSSSDNSTKIATTAMVQAAIATAVSAGASFRSGYDASSNLYPSTGGSGTGGAIQSGDFWVITVAGSLGGKAVAVGSLLFAIVDTPGQTASNWVTVNSDFVVGPSSSTDGAVSLYNGTTGKIIKNSGVTITGGLLDAINATSLNLSGLTASQAVVTDGSKNLTSLQYTNANTASTLVQRDSSGNFSAGTVTAALSGNATTATTLATPRAIYGNNFDGSAALNQVIASTYGGTGNGFAKLSGPTTSEKTFTLPDASDTIGCLGQNNTWTGTQSFNDGKLALNGATSGAITLKAAGTAGTNTITLPAGTTDFSATGGTSQVVKQTSAGGAFTVGQLSYSDISGSVTLPTGSVVQVVNTSTGAVATGTTLIPYDNTIPQNTEGDQYMSCSITPMSATNKLKIEVVANCTHSAISVMTAALFQDSTAGALAAASFNMYSGGTAEQITFTHYMTTGTTSATTFKVRIGSDTAGTLTFNGVSAGRKLGGVMASSITITEIKA